MADRPGQRPGANVRLDGRRVLLVLAGSTGGIGRHVRSLADGLRARGAVVRVAAPTSTQQVFGFPGHARLELDGSHRVACQLAAVVALRRLAERVDLVHVHGLRAACLGPTNVPLVATWHNVRSAGDGWGALLERHAARRARVTLAASEDLARRARACGARDVRLAPVAAPALLPAGRDPGLGSPLVLAVGRLHPQKGYDTLLEALPQLDGVTVAVAGDGPLRRQLTARAPQVHWLGHRTDVADLYAAADVVVLPSTWEARSLTAQEAMRAGRPLVVTDVGALPELVRDGAVVVPAGDGPALARAVRRLLDHPAEAAALGRRAAETARAWPDAADTIAQVAAVYAELLG